MSRPNLFISSFRYQQMIKASIWTVIFMLVVDVALNNIFLIPYIHDKGSSLENYFEYGRSVESKIMTMIGDDNTNAHSLARAGWLKPKEENIDIPRKKGEVTNVYIYGMSFSNHIGGVCQRSCRVY